MFGKTVALGALVAGVLAIGNPANATVLLSTAGNFTADNEVLLIPLTLTTGEFFKAVTLGYGGGTQADGNVVPAGGFDPSLALFNSSGTRIALNDDSGDGGPNSCGASAVKADDGSAFDACIALVLPAGTYTLAITEYDNDSNGPNLVDGFFETAADPTNTSFTSAFGCSDGQFCDVNGDNRTSAFAIDVTVPEPGTLPLFAAGLLALGMMRRRWSK